MANFVNNVSRCVTESLEGLALGSFGNLVLVRNKNVILINPEKNKNSNKVAIVCGGGSGHEPAHSSFVNHEMLSAAICGDVFASPSIGSIVDGIRTLFSSSDNSHKTVLVIIKNYTGDKINFGMACEILSSEEILLKKLIVADDVSLPEINERRGVAGTVLVYKIAGALAQQARNNNNMQQQLNEVYGIAKKANDNIHSMGCALSSCHRPDGSTIFSLPEGEMEIGVGIHGERGVSRVPMKSSDEVVTVLIDKILSVKGEQRDENSNNDSKRLVLLTNNLGSVSGLEMGIVHRKAISYLREKGYEVCRAYCGTYMTCLDMRGISLTLLTVVDDKFLVLLDVDGSGFAKNNWKPDIDYDPSSSSIYIDAPSSLDSDVDINNSKKNNAVDKDLMINIDKVCKAGIAARETLNNLDSECGDSDAGDTLATACNAILSNIQYFSVSDVNLSFKRIARCLTDVVGGTSGPLYAVFFIRAAEAFCSNTTNKEWKSISNWKKAVQNGISGIEELGGCSRGDKTILDALYPVYDLLKDMKAESEDSMERLIQVAKEASEKTRNLEARAGRARYVQGKGLGQVDPGAYAVYLLLKALL
ncbi:MAG: DAK2 domain-containing protein [Candidatus Brocadiaceae bacterium]|nr:DAK2 domain-containing protein [Candidatus Brocadiaceae bacterium]